LVGANLLEQTELRIHQQNKLQKKDHADTRAELGGVVEPPYRRRVVIQREDAVSNVVIEGSQDSGN
jgi:hypothetical protein